MDVAGDAGTGGAADVGADVDAVGRCTRASTATLASCTSAITAAASSRESPARVTRAAAARP